MAENTTSARRRRRDFRLPAGTRYLTDEELAARRRARAGDGSGGGSSRRRRIPRPKAPPATLSPRRQAEYVRRRPVSAALFLTLLLIALDVARRGFLSGTPGALSRTLVVGYVGVVAFVLVGTALGAGDFTAAVIGGVLLLVVVRSADQISGWLRSSAERIAGRNPETVNPIGGR